MLNRKVITLRLKLPVDSITYWFKSIFSVATWMNLKNIILNTDPRVYTLWFYLYEILDQEKPVVTKSRLCGCPLGAGEIDFFFFLIWNASRICMPSLCRGHANLCIAPILLFVLPNWAWDGLLKGTQNTVWDDGNVLCLNWVGVTGGYTFVQAFQTLHLKWVNFLVGYSSIKLIFHKCSFPTEKDDGELSELTLDGSKSGLLWWQLYRS